MCERRKDVLLKIPMTTFLMIKDTYGWILAEEEDDVRNTDLLAILLKPERNMVVNNEKCWSICSSVL